MKKIILLFIAIVISSVAFSQTAYEKKCAQIFKKYWNLFYPGHSVSNFEMNSIGVYEKAKGLLQIGALNYAMQTGKNVDAIFNQMEKEYAAARTLMTKEEKQDYIVEQERKTHYGKIKWDTGLEFLKWMQKDEYEKTDDYNNRLTTSTAIYDSLLHKNIKYEIENESWDYSIGKYDADAEVMKFLFYDKDKVCRISHTVNIPIETAKKINEGVISLRMYYNDDEILMDSEDLVLVPRFFYLRTQNNYYESQKLDYEFDNIELLNHGLSLVKYKYDELNLGLYGIENKYMKGHIFDYNKDAEKNRIRDSIARREQEIRDSIARREQEIRRHEQEIKDSIAIAQYNDELSKSLRLANDELKANKYNIKGYQINDPDNEFSIGKNSESLYFGKQQDLVIRKNQLVSNINAEYNDAKSKYGSLYVSDNEFDSFYCKGESFFKAETESRLELCKVKNELERNRQSIASVNFRKDLSNMSLSNMLAVTSGEQITDYSDANKYRHELIAWVNQLKDKPYYDYVINYLISNNAGLNKEYTKNGSFFSSEVDFYEAFISDKYKDILKSKKK